MAIQFKCPACSEPIEIDEQYAGQQVVCPYCQGVVTAPPTSQPEVAALPPMSAASDRPPAPPSPTGAPYAPAPPEPTWTGAAAPLRSNPAGNWSLAAGVLAWILFAVYVGYAASVMLKLLPPEVFEQASSSQPTTEEMQEHLQKAMKRMASDPGLATERAVVSTLSLASLGVGLLAIVLAVVGLTRKSAKKGTSIAGLVVSAPLLMCVALALLTGIAQTAAPAAIQP
jgi:hypothetical protein